MPSYQTTNQPTSLWRSAIRAQPFQLALGKSSSQAGPVSSGHKPAMWGTPSHPNGFKYLTRRDSWSLCGWLFGGWVDSLIYDLHIAYIGEDSFISEMFGDQVFKLIVGVWEVCQHFLLDPGDLSFAYMCHGEWIPGENQSRCLLNWAGSKTHHVDVPGT